METLDTVLTRRSVSRLSEPAPDDGQLLILVKAAMTAPDHGRLLPWRLVTLRGEERVELGVRLAACSADDPRARERAAAKPLRAPLLIAIVFAPVAHRTIPRWEQLASTAAAIQTLSLLLHDRGYASIWRTGAATRDHRVRALHSLRPDEQLLGWLYTGTAVGNPPPRRLPDPTARIRTLTQLAAPHAKVEACC
ncbi:nitroreductase [Streptomyces sp. NPDC093261]|uniref:nitroreductase family protein n=1 Tax=Streptomyces sp. NPDC093261 TaxID=3366037 RepID=UPI00382094A6